MTDRLSPESLAETVEVPVDVLVEVVAALRIAYITALTVKPTLETPYRDDPRWTPWTRWAGPAARMAFDARRMLGKSLPPELACQVAEAARYIHPIPTQEGWS